jgi:hypothetical protein
VHFLSYSKLVHPVFPHTTLITVWPQSLVVLY